jgi:hypothetical protein
VKPGAFLALASLLCSQGILPGCGEAKSGAPKLDASVSNVRGSLSASDAGRATDAGVRGKRAGRALHTPPRVKLVSPGVAQLIAAQALPAEDVVLAAGQELVLDFSAGARVHLRGPATLRSDVAERDALLVRDGTLSVDLAPGAAKPDSGFSLTTPSAAFSLVRGGAVALRSAANGSTVAVVVSGVLALSAAGSAFPEAERPLVAGERAEIRLDGRLSRSLHAAKTLEQALQALARLPEPRRDDGAFGSLEAALRARLTETEGELARERELVTAHRATLSAGEDAGEQRMALQSELAAHAETLSRAKDRLRTALAQRAASGLSSARGSEDRLSQDARQLLAPSP